MAITEKKKMNRAEVLLGYLFGYRETYEPNNELLDKAVWAFKDYVQSIRPPIGKKKEWLELLESLNLKAKDV